MSHREIIKFLFELGQLSRVRREGWSLIGVSHPESVAEHSLRAAQIGWVLASLDGYPNPNEVATMLVFHDIGECRVGDLHKLANRYVSVDEQAAVREQLSRLGPAGSDLFRLWEQVEERSTTAGLLAKDADLLELAVRAREYIEQGYQDAEEWFANASRLIRTEPAKALMAELPHVRATEWWHGLKKL